MLSIVSLGAGQAAGPHTMGGDHPPWLERLYARLGHCLSFTVEAEAHRRAEKVSRSSLGTKNPCALFKTVVNGVKQQQNATFMKRRKIVQPKLMIDDHFF